MSLLRTAYELKGQIGSTSISCIFNFGVVQCQASEVTTVSRNRKDMVVQPHQRRLSQTPQTRVWSGSIPFVRTSCQSLEFTMRYLCGSRTVAVFADPVIRVAGYPLMDVLYVHRTAISIKCFRQCPNGQRVPWFMKLKRSTHLFRSLG